MNFLEDKAMSDPATFAHFHITLTPPEPIMPIPKERALAMVPVLDDEHKQLDENIAEFINFLVSSGIDTDSFKNKLDAIYHMGNDEIRLSAIMSKRILEQTMEATHKSVFNHHTPISKTLINLHKILEKLDPSTQHLLSARKLLGFIPFGNKLKRYFRRYQSAQVQLNTIIETLYNTQEELRENNKVIETEKAHLWEVIGKMEQFIYLGKQINSILERRVSDIERQSIEKSQLIKEKMLFTVPQKVESLLSQLAVSLQAYLVLDMVRKNNMELIKGIDRISTTTISALRVAVIAAQVLTKQKLILEQINALNTPSGNMIPGTAEMLKQQAVEANQQTTNAITQIDKLKVAFIDIFAIMEILANYKTEAFANMQQAVHSLSSEIEKSNHSVDKLYQEKTERIAVDTLLKPSNSFHL